MQRFNYHIPGTPPATLLRREDDPGKPPVITLLSYNQEECLEMRADSVEELTKHLKDGRVHWINLQGLGDLETIREIGKLFDLHPLALEDVLNTTQRPKLEQYGSLLFLVSGMLYFDKPEELISEQLSIFLGENFVITMQEERGEDLFERIRERIRSGKGYARTMQSDYLAYCILDATVDSAFPILEVLGDGLEDLETALMERPTRETLKKLYEVKRLLLQVRRVIWPHREIFAGLMRDDSGLVRTETQVFLRDCYDHTTQLIDMIESFRDLAAGLMDVYLSSVGVRTNEIMRVLTLVSTFFIPMTFLAGVYGMNFDTDSRFNMPELHWKFGYLYFWGICVCIGLGMYLFFRRKHWI